MLMDLRHLNLSDTGVTGPGMCSLARMKQLTYLSLSHSGAPCFTHSAEEVPL